jgi:hypothetical protein
LAPLFDDITATLPVLKCIFVAEERTRSRAAAVHATSHSAVDRRRSARFAGSGARSTAQTCQHRTGVTRVIAVHFFDHAFCVLISSMEIGVRSLSRSMTRR